MIAIVNYRKSLRLFLHDIRKKRENEKKIKEFLVHFVFLFTLLINDFKKSYKAVYIKTVYLFVMFLIN